MQDRKLDHIELALQSKHHPIASTFYYEPLLSSHPWQTMDLGLNFLGAKMQAPLWISSMTGGTEKARVINHNLAKLANHFGLGMGLGSCRSLLESRERMQDFALREVIGDNPFFANLGIAQLEQLIEQGQMHKVQNLINDLQVDGLIIHVNPLQEWAQMEGDRYKEAPLETIKRCLDLLKTKIIVKEVGQGFGPNSLISLMNLPLAAIDLAGLGGTNFVLVELARHSALSAGKREALLKLANIGHYNGEMIQWVNDHLKSSKSLCREFIISGGIDNMIDGYQLQLALKAPSIIGMGSAFLKYAENFEDLMEFTQTQLESLKLAQCFLKERI
jgi:isopentenyl-diphosphate Delta-isomerase